MFQHTAARRRLCPNHLAVYVIAGFNTQPPEGGCTQAGLFVHAILFQHTAARRRLAIYCVRELSSVCFNTQPPEGGCTIRLLCNLYTMFQHTAARRRLAPLWSNWASYGCFNTQPPEGGCCAFVDSFSQELSFNTQPPEGGCFLRLSAHRTDLVSTHSRPKAAGRCGADRRAYLPFQHTAARRRLCLPQKPYSIRFRSPDFAKFPRKAWT